MAVGNTARLSIERRSRSATRTFVVPSPSVSLASASGSRVTYLELRGRGRQMKAHPDICAQFARRLEGQRRTPNDPQDASAMLLPRAWPFARQTSKAYKGVGNSGSAEIRGNPTLTPIYSIYVRLRRSLRARPAVEQRRANAQLHRHLGRALTAHSPELKGLLFMLLGMPRSLARRFADPCLHVGSSGF